MKRGHPPKRSAPLKRNGRIPNRSMKRLEEQASRRLVVDAALHRDGSCRGREAVPEVTCQGPLDVDEIVSRARYPGGHLDLDNVQVLCRAHHDWKHAEPEAAVERGLARWSWEAR